MMKTTVSLICTFLIGLVCLAGCAGSSSGSLPDEPEYIGKFGVIRTPEKYKQIAAQAAAKVGGFYVKNFDEPSFFLVRMTAEQALNMQDDPTLQDVRPATQVRSFFARLVSRNDGAALQEEANTVCTEYGGALYDTYSAGLFSFDMTPAQAAQMAADPRLERVDFDAVSSD